MLVIAVITNKEYKGSCQDKHGLSMCKIPASSNTQLHAQDPFVD